MTRFLAVLSLLVFAAVAGCRGDASNGGSLAGSAAAGSASDSAVAIDPWSAYTFAQRQGKRAYEHYCAVCHGDTGEGDGFNSYNLDPRPRSFADSLFLDALSDESLYEMIAFGGRGVNKSVLMPAYQNTLSKDQILYILKYIRTFAAAPREAEQP